MNRAYIISGIEWKDTAGNQIQAHGAGFVKVGDTYYWFGEDKSHDNQTFSGINCYSSRDLANWKYNNKVLKPVPGSDLDGKKVGERPKVLYNKHTGKYIMYLHVDSLPDYGMAAVGTAVCDTVNGDYTYMGSFRPLGSESRDMTLFKDDDETAYLIHSTNGNKDIRIERLSRDCLSVKNNVCTLFEGCRREAPAMVKKDGMYYLFTSGCLWWAPTKTMYSTANSIKGPWSGLRNVGQDRTHYSQPAYILSIEGKYGTSCIFCADRWYGNDSGEMFNIGLSKYVWLPLVLDGTRALLNYYTSWYINTVEGVWDTFDRPALLVYHNDFEVAFDMKNHIFSGNWEIKKSTIDGSSKALINTGTEPGIMIFPEKNKMNEKNRCLYIQSLVKIESEECCVSVLATVDGLNEYYEFGLGKEDLDHNKCWYVKKVSKKESIVITKGPFIYKEGMPYVLRLGISGEKLIASISEDMGKTFVILDCCPFTCHVEGKAGLMSCGSSVFFDNIQILQEAV